MRLNPVLVAAAVVAAPLVSFAQRGDLTHSQPASQDAAVDFGVAPTGPLGPPPCLQSGGIGGPGDPCAYKIHHLTPEEVTILKGGQVTFQVRGGGHALHIYEVSKDTTRDEIGQFLCAGEDPATITDPDLHACNRSDANANAEHVIADGHGSVVIIASPNVTGAHPDNRVWYEPGRLMSAGGIAFLSNTQLVTYRFLKTGRYLVTCMNRTHFLNDWMFGFVNVTGQ